jgi:hypothetical protein
MKHTERGSPTTPFEYGQNALAGFVGFIAAPSEARNYPIYRYRYLTQLTLGKNHFPFLAVPSSKKFFGGDNEGKLLFSEYSNFPKCQEGAGPL